MEVDHDKVRRVVEEDRLSSLPDELIHKILSSFDIKFVGQTCVLSSRWKLLWTSLPSLNFSSWGVSSLPKFAKFVKHVLSHRNHQVDVSSVSLYFHGAASQVFVKKIVNYAFYHNVQYLKVTCYPKKRHVFHPSLFSSKSLKHLTLTIHRPYSSPCITPKTPWDFPALTTLHLDYITVCDDSSRKSVDLFSKCVNLKNLTLECFSLKNVEVFDIITPRLSNLVLKHGSECSAVINLIAPQLEDLTVSDCSFKYLNAPPGLSSLYYWGQYWPMQLSKDPFHSVNEVTFVLTWSDYHFYGVRYEEEHAHKTINMLQQLRSARYLTLSIKIIECLSSFPDLVSHYPSPFSNLICLTIFSGPCKDASQVEMSMEARNFLLENSPNAKFIVKSRLRI